MDIVTTIQAGVAWADIIVCAIGKALWEIVLPASMPFVVLIASVVVWLMVMKGVHDEDS